MAWTKWEHNIQTKDSPEDADDTTEQGKRPRSHHPEGVCSQHRHVKIADVISTCLMTKEGKLRAAFDLGRREQQEILLKTISPASLCVTSCEAGENGRAKRRVSRCWACGHRRVCGAGTT